MKKLIIDADPSSLSLTCNHIDRVDSPGTVTYYMVSPESLLVMVSSILKVLIMYWCNVDYLDIEETINKEIQTWVLAKRDIEAVRTSINQLLNTISSVIPKVAIESLTDSNSSIARDKYSDYLSLLKRYLVNDHYSQLNAYGERLEKSCYIYKQFKIKDKVV